MLDAVHDKAFQLLRDGQDHRPAHRPRRRAPRPAPLPARTCSSRPSQRARRPPRRHDDATWWSKRSSPAPRSLPAEWPIHGTTGYELLNVVNGLFVDPAGAARSSSVATSRIREGTGTFDDLLYRAKKLILRTAMSSELHVLARAPRPDLRAAPVVARLHRHQPAPGSRRDDRLLPCLPDLRPDRTPSQSRAATGSTCCGPSGTPSGATAPPANRSSTSSPTSCCSAIRRVSPTPITPNVASSSCACNSSPAR